MPYDPNNSGSLGRNDKKGDNPKRPDYRGKCTVAGVEYYIAGWIKESTQGRNAGSKFISMRFEPVEKPEAHQNEAQQPDTAPNHSDTNDDPPF